MTLVNFILYLFLNSLSSDIQLPHIRTSQTLSFLHHLTLINYHHYNMVNIILNHKFRKSLNLESESKVTFKDKSLTSNCELYFIIS